MSFEDLCALANGDAKALGAQLMADWPGQGLALLMVWRRM